MLHPASLVALAVMVGNDHWGKHAYPGFVTGKLSDVAGLVFFPLLLVALVETARRGVANPIVPSVRLLALAVGVTGVVFACVKTLEPAANAFGWGLGLLQWPARTLAASVGHGVVRGVVAARVLADPTDLLALPALLVPWAVGGARAALGSRPPHLA